MVGYRWVLFSLAAVLVAGANSAQAFDDCVRLWYVPYRYSYSTPTYYYYPSVRAATVVPLEGNAAKPIPAPPSPAKTKNVLESMKQRPPTIIATRALAPIAPQKDRCRIGFWNLSGRDATLTVAGKTWTLPKDRSLTLELERNFSWQANHGPEQAERIPENQAAHEVIIRE